MKCHHIVIERQQIRLAFLSNGSLAITNYTAKEINNISGQNISVGLLIGIFYFLKGINYKNMIFFDENKELLSSSAFYLLIFS